MKTLLKAAAAGTAVLVLGTGTAWSATGGTFVLGQAMPTCASTQTGPVRTPAPAPCSSLL